MIRIKENSTANTIEEINPSNIVQLINTENSNPKGNSKSAFFIDFKNLFFMLLITANSTTNMCRFNDLIC